MHKALFKLTVVIDYEQPAPYEVSLDLMDTDEGHWEHQGVRRFEVMSQIEAVFQEWKHNRVNW